MKIAKETLELMRGDDCAFRLLVLNVDKTPVALDDARFDLHATTYEDALPVLQLSSTDGSIDVADGRVVLHFSHEMTRDAHWTQAQFDLQMHHKGKRRTILQGKIKLHHDITRI